MCQDEVSKGLPPIKAIEHKIDFIPKAIIPNRSAYRVNSTEIKDIQRKVEKLMEKGYIREILSPCFVLVINYWDLCPKVL